MRYGKKNSSFRVLYVGRLIYWKGLHLGLEAFARLTKNYPEAELTVIGVGQEEQWLTLRARELGIGDCTRWIGKVEHSELQKKYADFDVFLFPSLHDSSGNVVLEAMSAGLPVICLDLGGPPMMVDGTCGCVVPARDATQEEVIAGLYKALVRYAKDRNYQLQCSEGAKNKAYSMSWHNTVADVYDLISHRVIGS